VYHVRGRFFTYIVTVARWAVVVVYEDALSVAGICRKECCQVVMLEEVLRLVEKCVRGLLSRDHQGTH
jgi:hypothetical protein